jgi:hypothetical protein
MGFRCVKYLLQICGENDASVRDHPGFAPGFERKRALEPFFRAGGVHTKAERTVVYRASWTVPQFNRQFLCNCFEELGQQQQRQASCRPSPLPWFRCLNRDFDPWRFDLAAV